MLKVRLPPLFPKMQFSAKGFRSHFILLRETIFANQQQKKPKIYECRLVREAWPVLFDAAKTAEGLSRVSEIFRMCKPLGSMAEVHDLAEVVKVSFDTLAMGQSGGSGVSLTGVVAYRFHSKS